MKLKPALLLAVLLSAAGPALSAPAAPARTAAADAAMAGRLQQWLQELATWSLPFNAILTENAEVMGALIDGAIAAGKHYDEGDFKQGKAWAATWSKEANRKLDALNARRSSLPGPPPPIPAGATGMDEMQSRLDKVPDFIRAVDTLLANSVAGGRRYITVIAEAGGGSQTARSALPGLGIDTSITLLRGENSFLEFAKLTTQPGHPQYDLTDAGIQSNLGVIAFLEYRRAEAYGEEPDPKAFATRIRSAAEASLAASRSMRSNAKNAQASLKKAQGAAVPLATLVGRAVETYDESAAVEEQIAAALARIADGVADGEDLDGEPVLAAGQALEQLALKRASLDTRRREIIAGKP